MLPDSNRVPAHLLRISVVINIRNGSATLPQALDSLLAQTYEDWEAICWDDRSTDDSKEVVGRYPDPRIRYFWSPEDATLGRARELAIQEARGDWLAFLDQDDIWMPEKLAWQMAVLDREPSNRVGLIYGRTVSFDERGVERDYDYRHEFEPLPEGDIFNRLFDKSCFIAMSAALIRLDAYRELGGIPPAIQVTPDYYLFAGVARRWEARAVEEVVCRYRRHSNSMTHRSHKRINEEILLLIDMWAADLPPLLTARRRRIHHTVLAAYDLFHVFDIRAGLTRLYRHGSFFFLATRPFARAFRRLRRHFVRPMWLRARTTCVAPVRQVRRGESC